MKDGWVKTLATCCTMQNYFTDHVIEIHDMHKDEGVPKKANQFH